MVKVEGSVGGSLARSPGPLSPILYIHEEQQEKTSTYFFSKKLLYLMLPLPPSHTLPYPRHFSRE